MDKKTVKLLLDNKSAWADKVPCFVVDKKRLQENIDSLKKCLKGEIAYSHKTNPDPLIIRSVMDNDCSLLISSIEELGEMVKMNNFSGKNIIFQSPSLTLEQYIITRKLGVHRYSIDSFDYY